MCTSVWLFFEEEEHKVSAGCHPTHYLFWLIHFLFCCAPFNLAQPGLDFNFTKQSIGKKKWAACSEWLSLLTWTRKIGSSIPGVATIRSAQLLGL